MDKVTIEFKDGTKQIFTDVAKSASTGSYYLISTVDTDANNHSYRDVFFDLKDIQCVRWG